jgi:hypothetical protein
MTELAPSACSSPGSQDKSNEKKAKGRFLLLIGPRPLSATCTGLAADGVLIVTIVNLGTPEHHDISALPTTSNVLDPTCYALRARLALGCSGLRWNTRVCFSAAPLCPQLESHATACCGLDSVRNGGRPNFEHAMGGCHVFFH